MNIGQAAARTGVPAKTIRYYEEIGLVTPTRSANGYRQFGDRQVERLAFLRRARALGFSIEDCRSLLDLWSDSDRAAADVRRIAAGHLSTVNEKIEQLRQVRATLDALVNACAGDDRADCPILDSLDPRGARDG